ncbi:Ig-like domain-containing protein [Pseudoduganella flava]|uniref:Ig-like domain-containing protein n=1 Tax=Pseudoduganella flava TaxID=871742 RepID=A0A562Q2W5_9BURK|nr:Ig-like domain-containing protein [Pseudoduganella flava]QGZ41111.1 hypothetical protein GO485_20000 [Pseudoduganella flava]TWI51035.1 Ig-like domain-containing protein [Pseudoduganella flava]
MPTDKTRPLLTSATPADDSGAVAVGADIVLTFSEAVKAGSGKIFVSNGATQTYLGADGQLHTRIVNATDTRAIDIADTSQVTIAGNKLTLNLAADLRGGTGYSVIMEGGVVTDLAGNSYAGLTDGTRLNFVTHASDQIKPTVAALTLSDYYLETGEHATLTLTMSERVTGITAADFDVVGAWIDGPLTSADGITWTATVVPNTDQTGDGRITFHAGHAVDMAGNQATGTTTSLEFGIHTPNGLSFRLSEDTGAYDDDFVTNVATGQQIEISYELALAAGDRVQVSLDGTHYTDANLVASDGGSFWTLSGVDLPGASGTITVRVLDVTGAVKTSLSRDYTVDTTASAPSAESATVTLDAASNSGSTYDTVTNATTPWVAVHLAGAAGYHVGDVIEVWEDGAEGSPAGRTVLQATDFDAAGNLLSTSVKVLVDGSLLGGTEGTHDLKARVTDAAGNGSYGSALLHLQIDTTGPALVDSAPDEGEVVSGVLPTITLRFSEDVEINAQTTFVLASDKGDRQEFVGEQVGALSYDAATHTLTVTLDHAKLDGGAHYSFTTSNNLYDEAGNLGWYAEHALLEFTTQADGTIVPVTPTLALRADTASRSGGADEARDGITNDRQIDVAGLQAGGSWEYSIDGGSTWQDGDGGAILLPNASASYAAGKILVKQYDAPGQTGHVSAIGSMDAVTIDVTKPQSAIDYKSFDFFGIGSAISFYGSIARAGAGDDIVEYTVDGGATWQRAASNGSAVIDIANANVPRGGAIGVQVSDIAGNLATNVTGASSVYVGDGYGGTFTVTAGTALFAQRGDDTIQIGGTGFALIDGGTGNDTLRFTSGLDMRLDAYTSKLANIEIIDLNAGTGTASTLRLTKDAIEHVTAAHTLTVTGDASDKVVFIEDGWSLAGTSGGYANWVNDGVTVLVGVNVVAGSLTT